MRCKSKLKRQKRKYEYSLEFLKLPYFVLFDNRLNPSDKLLFAYVYTLDQINNQGVQSTNKYFALRLKECKNTSSASVQRLKQTGYFTVTNPKSKARRIWITSDIRKRLKHDKQFLKIDCSTIWFGDVKPAKAITLAALYANKDEAIEDWQIRDYWNIPSRTFQRHKKSFIKHGWVKTYTVFDEKVKRRFRTMSTNVSERFYSWLSTHYIIYTRSRNVCSKYQQMRI